MGRPSKGERRIIGLRVPRNLHLELGHYSLDKERDLNEILLEVIAAWWEKQPERASYEKLREANAPREEAPKKPATKKK